jgi:predicted lipoprotein with Yx(FWY)xxD motif
VPGTIGVITRTDGTQQVTLDGHPLYHFSGDKAAGDTNGNGFGGIWHVVTTSGASSGGGTTTTAAGGTHY